MPQTRSVSRRIFLVSGLTSLTVGAFLFNSQLAQAQAPSFVERVLALFDRRRVSRFASGRSRGGAVRGSCAALEVAGERLTALIPSQTRIHTVEAAVVENIGLTVEPYPTFWLYVPYSRQTIAQAEFMLLDEAYTPVLAAPIPIALPEIAGTIYFRLPSTVPPLEVGKTYNWYFTLSCSDRNPSRNPVVNGWITRVAPPSAESSGSVQARYDAYLQDGLWYDALTTLAQLGETRPAQWRDGIKTVFGFSDAIAQAQITEVYPG